MFEELAKHITTDEGKAALKKAQDSFSTVKSELETNEKKLIDAISSRDKFKEFTKLTKSKLGIEDGSELNEDTLSEKISGLTKKVSTKASEAEEILKKDILNLQNQLKENETKFQETLTSKDSELFNTKFNIRVSDSMKGLKLVNEKAYDMIHSEIANGATYSEDLKEYIFTKNDGTIERNSDGTHLTVEQRVELVSTSDDFSFLIAAPQNSGSGEGQHSTNNTSGMTEYEKLMASV